MHIQTIKNKYSYLAMPINKILKITATFIIYWLIIYLEFPTYLNTF